MGDLLSGRYDLRELLSEGQQGAVYRARDSWTGATVAVKIFKEVPDPEGLRIWADLRHPNIVELLDVAVDSDVSYLVMEYIQGPSLAEAYQTFGESVFLQLINDVGHALRMAHSRGICHCDVKPTNILVEARGSDSVTRARLTDFGLWRSVETRPEDFGGTLAYAAPEVLRGDPPDQRSDLYSLGATIFEILTGRPVFQGEDVRAVVEAHLTALPPDPADLNPAISKHLSAFVLRLLEKEPTRRPGSVAEMASLVGGDSPSSTNLGHPSWTNRTRSWRFIHRLLVFAEQRQGSVVFIGGKQGVGRTTLLRHLLFDQGVQGKPCLSLSTNDELVGKDASDEIVRRTELLAGQSAREMLHASKAHRFVEAARRVAGNDYMVVLLDDIDAADRTFHEFIEAVAPLIATESILFIATCESRSISTFRATMPRLFTLPHVRRICLRSFTPAESNELAASLLCSEHVDAELGALLYRASGGNPGFAQESLRQLILRGYLRLEAGRWLSRVLPDSWDIEEGMVQLIEAKLRALGSAERSVLGIVALFGAPVPENLLRSVAPFEETRFDAALRTLLDLDLIARRGSGWGLKQTLYAGAAEAVFSAEERASYHATLAETVQSRWSNDPAWQSILVHHLLHSGSRSEAYECAMNAAARTLHEKRYSRSVAFYEQAEACLDQLDGSLGIQVLRGQAICYYRLGHYTKALERLSRLFGNAAVQELDQGEQINLRLTYAKVLAADGRETEARQQLKIVMETAHPSKRAMTEAHAAAAVVAAEEGEWAEAAEHARTCLELIDGMPHHPLRSQVENTYGVALMMQGMFLEAQPHLEASYRLRDEAGESLDAARCALNLGILFRRVGKYDDAAQWATAARTRYEATGSAAGQAQADNMYGSVEMARGDAKEAVLAFERSVSRAMASAQWRIAGLALTNLSRALRAVGERSQALIQLNEAWELAGRRKDRYLSEIVASNLGGYFLSGGDHTAAETWFLQARALAEEAGNPLRIADNLRGLARLRREKGELDHAERLLNEALGALGGSDDELSSFHTNCELAELRLAQGDFDGALRAAEAASTSAGHFGPRERTRALQILGEVNTLVGALDEASDAFRECLELVEAIGFPADRASARLEVGRWLMKAGPVAGFRAPERYLTQAQEDFQRLGMHHRSKEAEQLLEDLVSLAGTGVETPTTDTRKLASLYRMMTLLNSAQSSEGLLDQVLDLAVHAVQGERGLIILVDRESAALTIKAQTEMDGTTIADARRISESVVKRVAGAGQPVFSADALNDIRFTEHDSIRINRIACFMCVPLSVRGQIVGTIYVDSCNLSHHFANDDVSYLIAFANNAAIAMENLRLREELEEENRYLQDQLKTAYSFETIVGSSPAMKTVFDAMAAVARSAVTVVIQGETGTGKELVARAIHYSSPRAKNRFVPVNCSALPDTLLESELFGYARGAFTGAVKSTEGLFLLADHGTMFLDEITDMSPSLQAKLLRVLESGEVKPLGQPAIRKVDVRVVCATNKDLEQEMLLGRFREDLYYRLKVVSIRLPSLGERREDIPLLAAHFLNKYSKQFDQRIRGFTEDALAFLCLRDWPGNVRELEHVIEAAVALSPSRVIDKSALWLAQGRSASTPDSPPSGLSLSEARRSLERRFLTRALRETAWNVSAASRNLGMSRRQLQRLMRRYELGRGRPSVSIPV